MNVAAVDITGFLGQLYQGVGDFSPPGPDVRATFSTISLVSFNGRSDIVGDVAQQIVNELANAQFILRSAGEGELQFPACMQPRKIDDQRNPRCA